MSSHSQAPTGAWHGAVRHVFKRLLGLCAVLLIVSILVFALTRLAAGDPMAVLLGDQATETDIAQARAQYGLDKPLLAQYFLWGSQVLQGNLGRSIFMQAPVGEVIADRAALTTWLALMAAGMATLIGVPLGVASAVWRGRAVDSWLSGLAMLGASVPSFWFGLVLIQWFGVRYGWFPVSGFGEPEAALGERLYHLVLPSITLGVLNSALIMRFTRASMLDVLNEDYIRTARSKGLSEWVVVFKHAFRNTLIPILTVVGLTLALMVGGAVITETVFNLPGFGNLVVRSVLRRDYPVIQGALLTIAAVYVLINFAIDLLYVVVDPRVRHG